MIGLLAPVIGGAVKTMCMSMLSEKLLQQVILILLTKLGRPQLKASHLALTYIEFSQFHLSQVRVIQS